MSDAARAADTYWRDVAIAIAVEFLEAVPEHRRELEFHLIDLAQMKGWLNEVEPEKLRHLQGLAKQTDSYELPPCPMLTPPLITAF